MADALWSVVGRGGRWDEMLATVLYRLFLLSRACKLDEVLKAEIELERRL